MASRAFGREHRVADFLQRELSTFMRDSLRDPRIGMVTITEVRVTKDLAYADIYVSQLDRDDPQARVDLLEALRGAGGLMRSQIARSTSMRIVPRLRFQYDTTLEYGLHMDRLIRAARAKDRVDVPEADHSAGAAGSDPHAASASPAPANVEPVNAESANAALNNSEPMQGSTS